MVYGYRVCVGVEVKPVTICECAVDDDVIIISVNLLRKGNPFPVGALYQEGVLVHQFYVKVIPVQVEGGAFVKIDIGVELLHDFVGRFLSASEEDFGRVGR